MRRRRRRRRRRRKKKMRPPGSVMASHTTITVCPVTVSRT